MKLDKCAAPLVHAQYLFARCAMYFLYAQCLSQVSSALFQVSNTSQKLKLSPLKFGFRAVWVMARWHKEKMNVFLIFGWALCLMDWMFWALGPTFPSFIHFKPLKLYLSFLLLYFDNWSFWWTRNSLHFDICFVGMWKSKLASWETLYLLHIKWHKITKQK